MDPLPATLSATLNTDDSNPKEWLYFFIAFLLSAILLFGRAYVGWFNCDDGTMGQAAQRLLDGEVPHVDFIDTHTGGITFLHALAFRVLGENLATLRSVILCSWLLTLFPLYFLYRRFLSPRHSSLFIFATAAFAVAPRVSPLPSWYNCILAIWALFCLDRYFSTNRRYWLFLAGVCAGVSFLAKLAGLYLFAALLLVAIFCSLHRRDSARFKAPSALVVSGLLLFILLLGKLIYPLLSSVRVVMFFVPSTLVALSLIWRITPRQTVSFEVDVRKLIVQSVLLTIGFCGPIVLFLIPYLLDGTLYYWFEGVFIVPTRRFSFAAWTGVPLSYFLATTTLFIFLVYIAHTIRSPKIAAAISLIWFTTICLLPCLSPDNFVAVLMLFFTVQPLLICGALWRIAVLEQNPRLQDNQKLFFAICAVASLHALIQFPYFNSSYLFYTVPLHFLLLGALLSTASNGIARLILTSVAASIVLGVHYYKSEGIVLSQSLTIGPWHHKVDVPRGGIFLSERASRIYTEVTKEVVLRAQGQPVFAGPDCPEIHFLSGSKNPERSLFEFFEAIPLTERYPVLLQQLDEMNVKVAVINRQPGFSPKIPAELDIELQKRFPFHKTFARYEVRWRDLGNIPAIP